MRSNIVSEAGLSTRLGQYWEGIPFLTSSIVIVCGFIYLVCLLIGYDAFHQVCFWPSVVISRFQVYRIYTSVIFHGSLLHVMFNMLALIPLGSELERIMGSVRLSYLVFLLATCNAIFNLFIALVVAHSPITSYGYFMNECSIGFSGILFSMIVIETTLSGVESRSVFGLFNVPAKWYAWILLVLFQLIMSNVSLLGHLCGILSGFAYSYGFFNLLMPGTSIFSAVESSPLISTLARRPKFILCTAGNTSGYIPTHVSQSPTSTPLISGNLWRSFSSWMPRRETSEVNQLSRQDDSRFPGTGRTLASLQQTAPGGNPDSSLQARLLENNSLGNSLPHPHVGPPISEARQPIVNSAAATAIRNQGQNQALGASGEKMEKLVAMGFEKTQVEVALAAADGDVNVAVEILMSQQ